MRWMAIVWVVLVACEIPGEESISHTEGAVSADALAALIDEYRVSEGLLAVPRVAALDAVALEHVRDLADNAPHEAAGCNLHSWSDVGPWSACCFRGAADMDCMMQKPAELTDYAGRGFEVAVRVSTGVTPEHALALWQDSPAHDAVIANRDEWREMRWGAMGVAIEGAFAVVWFGEQSY